MTPPSTMSNTNVAYGSVYCIHDTRPLPPHTLHTRPPPARTRAACEAEDL